MAEENNVVVVAVPPGCPLPRITIQFCTQCKWMLRAAYFAQELLSTFSTALGEVALQPSTGGTFIVTIYHPTSSGGADAPDAAASSQVLWDRKTDGGFPETKELKRRVRDVVEPGRDLGHVDRGATGGRHSAAAKADRVDTAEASEEGKEAAKTDKTCEDCA